MGFLDELEQQPPRQSHYCRVRIAIETYPDQADDILAAIASTFPSAAVARVFKTHGIDIPLGTIKRHRAGDCKCPS